MSRKDFIGASEVAALFGCHPYLTKRELYHLKRGDIPENEETPVMRLGKHLESFVLKEVFPEHVPHDQDVKIYHPTIQRMAATPDAYIDDGETLVECKTVSRLPDAPHPHHVLQCHHQMMCTGKRRCILLYYDRSSASHAVFPIEANDLLFEEIRVRVNAFWLDFDMSIPPDVTAEDEGVIKHLIRQSRPGGEATITDDNVLHALLHNYDQAVQDERETDAIKSAAKTELLAYMQARDLSRLTTKEHVITLSVSDIPERTQTVKAQTRVTLTVKPRRNAP